MENNLTDSEVLINLGFEKEGNNYVHDFMSVDKNTNTVTIETRNGKIRVDVMSIKEVTDLFKIAVILNKGGVVFQFNEIGLDETYQKAPPFNDNVIRETITPTNATNDRYNKSIEERERLTKSNELQKLLILNLHQQIELNYKLNKL